ncbi:hypothetical protein C0989_001212 [Termitomyces sp. Mn162]|nr:hypothetical protein C0989_001212 [Termitomyces sp. Mn162]
MVEFPPTTSTKVPPEESSTELVKGSDKEVSVEEFLPVVEPFTSAIGFPAGRQEPVVNRRELWSYYCECLTCPLGSVTDKNEQYTTMGVGPMNYAMTLFQSLAFAAGYDPVKGPGSSCNADNASGRCVLPWAGGTKTVSSVVLVANGVSFAVHIFLCFLPTVLTLTQVMTLIFTTIGSAADYGTFGRWLLFVITVICWAAQYSTMSLTGVPTFTT